jgi:hypothetical protein
MSIDSRVDSSYEWAEVAMHAPVAQPVPALHNGEEGAHETDDAEKGNHKTDKSNKEDEPKEAIPSLVNPDNG